MGFLVSTALIVIFGEIIPQATCARYGLAIGYYTLPITLVIMACMSVGAYPISIALDYILGHETGQLWTRAEMMTLLKHQQKKSKTDKGEEVFGSDETDLMTKVLEFREILVKTAMTPIEDVFMLENNAVLNFDCLASIFQSGHSRIPIYEGTMESIVGLLFAKDLIMLNPEDQFMISDLMKFYNHYPENVYSDEPCSKLLNSFKHGKSHMAVVREVLEFEDGRDSEYKNVGIITLEDIIETLIGSEIVDETDIYASVKEHKLKKKLSSHSGLNGVDVSPRVSNKLSQSSFIDMFRRKKTHNSLSPQEVTTVYQVLRSDVAAFSQQNITIQDAKSLLSTCIIEQLNRGENDGRIETSDGLLYEKGKKCDFFLLVLEGRITVNAGTENFEVQLGPWKPLAGKALMGGEYISDFDASVTSETCRFLKIFYEDYASAQQGQLSRKNSRTALVPGSHESSPALNPVVATTEGVDIELH